mgnify:CR=1 FL=1
MSGKVGRPRTWKPKFCGNCGVKVNDNSKSLRCPQCSKNSYLPTRRQIDAECRLIRQERRERLVLEEKETEVNTVRQPKVYNLPRSFR